MPKCKTCGNDCRVWSIQFDGLCKECGDRIAQESQREVERKYVEETLRVFDKTNNSIQGRDSQDGLCLAVKDVIGSTTDGTTFIGDVVLLASGAYFFTYSHFRSPSDGSTEGATAVALGGGIPAFAGAVILHGQVAKGRINKAVKEAAVARDEHFGKPVRERLLSYGSVFLPRPEIDSITLRGKTLTCATKDGRLLGFMLAGDQTKLTRMQLQALAEYDAGQNSRADNPEDEFGFGLNAPSPSSLIASIRDNLQAPDFEEAASSRISNNPAYFDTLVRMILREKDPVQRGICSGLSALPQRIRSAFNEAVNRKLRSVKQEMRVLAIIGAVMTAIGVVVALSLALSHDSGGIVIGGLAIAMGALFGVAAWVRRRRCQSLRNALAQ